MKKIINVVYVSMLLPFEGIGNAGGKTFLHYIKALSKEKSVHITLIAKCTSKDDLSKVPSGVSVIPIYNEKISLLHPIHLIKDANSKFNIFYKYGNVLRATIYDQVLETIKKNNLNPDIFILEFTQMVLLAPKIRKLYSNAKIMASEHDVTFLHYQRDIAEQRGFFKRKIWTVRYNVFKKHELTALSKCDVIMPHNEKDAHLLRQNGIEKEKIQSIVPYYDHINLKIKYNIKSKKVVFYGAMNRAENYLSAEWFIEHVMSQLKNLNLIFYIVGGNPSKNLDKYKNRKDVVISGFVQNISEIFDDSLCFVAPLRNGAGIKVKVLEAMSAGMITLTNDIGIEGIPAKKGIDYIQCESADDYVQAIKSILNNEFDLYDISNSCTEMINKSFPLDSSTQNYIRTIERLYDL